jgi:hypothetical protein
MMDMNIQPDEPASLERMLSMVLLLAEKDGADRIAFGPLSPEDLQASKAWMRFRLGSKWREMLPPPNHIVQPLVTLMRSKAVGPTGVLYSDSGAQWRIESPGHQSRFVLIRD